MKIATLQFAPRLGEVAANFSRAESLLMRQEREGELKGIDLLVLPELAFTGESKALLGLFVSRVAMRENSFTPEDCQQDEYPWRVLHSPTRTGG